MHDPVQPVGAECRGPEGHRLGDRALAVGVPMISSGSGWARGFGFIALIFACVNIFGGFLVTQRMLAMYKKKAK